MYLEEERRTPTTLCQVSTSAELNHHIIINCRMATSHNGTCGVLVVYIYIGDWIAIGDPLVRLVLSKQNHYWA